MISIISISMGWMSQALAEFEITHIEILDIKNNSAKIKWTTPNKNTRGIVYYGQDSEKLNKWIGSGYSLGYNFNHEAVLSGLEKDKNYYYKIKAIDKQGQEEEALLQIFSTKGMLDTITPKFKSSKVLQVIGGAVALAWETDEETKAQIYYGTDSNDLNKKASSGRYEKKHEIFIYNLSPYSQYYFKITAEDRGKNKKSKTVKARIEASLKDKPELIISNIEPAGSQQSTIAINRAEIKWRTNMVARSKIYYGTESGRYKKTIDVNKVTRQTNHSILLENLEPATIYYYKIKAYDSFYGKNAETAEMTFTTKKTTGGEILAKEIITEGVDTDYDGLADSYELQIGTDPYNRDTDNDSYPDGVEVEHGYNPKGPGKSQEQLYFKPRMYNNIEQEKAIELKTALEAELGQLNVHAKHWPTIVSSYIYGNYPVHAIAQAIKFGGKTVHPSIPWQSWKSTSTYTEFIDK